MSLKIIHIIPNLKKGGAERLALDICNELTAREGLEVKLITFCEENDYAFLSDSLDWEVIPAKYVPSIKGKGVEKLKELQAAIDHYQPDVIHVHLFEAMIVLSRINYSRCRYVVHFHDNIRQLKKGTVKTLFNKRDLTEYYERKLVLQVYKKRKTLFLAISKDTQVYIQENLPRFESVLMFNAIDTKRFERTGNEVVENRLVNIGSLVDKKGQKLAVETIGVLRDRGVDVSLVLLGEGEMRTELEALVAQLGLKDKVLLKGKVDFPEAYLKSSLLYFHTAKYEPFGLVLVEAMAAELPVITTNGKGNRDLIEEGENGFMISNRNPSKLADKIKLLLNNEEQRLKMGKKAKEFSNNFNIKSYVDRLLKVYVS